jgi:hypothetical protein
MPLGYPYCYVDQITDTTANVNTYFIHPTAPKTPIQKVFQIGFYIDFAKTFQNVLFCSLGLTAKATCLTCPSVQPSMVVDITENGNVSLAVSSTDFSNIGLQTLSITVTDLRNIEQPAGVSLTFQVDFTTCSLSYTPPSDVSYVLRNPADSQTLVATESDSCLFATTCSLGSGAPTWVTNNNCSFSWSTSDTSVLASTLNTVPIIITYAKLPVTVYYTTSFTISLSCVSTNTFPALTATYTIGDTTASLPL